MNIYLVQLDKDAVVDLAQPEELQSLSHLRADLVNTETTQIEILSSRLVRKHYNEQNLPSDTDNKRQLGFSWDVEVSFFPGLSGQSNLISLLAAVFLDILFSSLEDLDPPGTTSFHIL